MVNNPAQSILEAAYTKEIADKTLAAYIEIESNFFLEKWKPSELDAGHFVEAIRRIIEHELTGQSTPFNQRISNFNDFVLTYYEQQRGHESFRMLIPRILKSIYNIRNKRGVGHISDISPNEMDSSYILSSIKWVLSEIIRLKSNLSIEDTQRLIDTIVERKVNIIWKESGIQRILKPNMPAKDQLLILIYDKSPQHIEEIRTIIEYKNKSNFTAIVQKYHNDRLLEYKNDGICIISPMGILAAEALIKRYKYNS